MNSIYTGAIAKDLAWLSALVYSDWKVVRRELRARDFWLAKIWDNGDTQGMLVYAPGHEWAAIVFRGTEASRIVREDIMANFGEPTPWAGRGKAHSGYAKALLKVAWPALQMAEQVSSAIPLYVAGHSMGGSLATLFSAWYARIFPGYKLAALAAAFGALASLQPTGGPWRRGVQAAVVVLAAWGIVRGMLCPLLNACLRRQERQADRRALEITHDPEALVRAYRKLALRRGPAEEPGRLRTWLFQDAPSLGDRLAVIARHADRRRLGKDRAPGGKGPDRSLGAEAVL